MSETKESGAHLREVARIPVRGDRFVQHGHELVVASLHGKAPHELSVVDLSAIEMPRVTARVPFKYQMQALAVVGDLAYVFEYSRAVHLVRLGPTPTTLDCHLMFKQQIYQFAPVGTRWLVAARNWEGISVFDVSDPLHPRETALLKLGDSFVEGLAVSGERIFASANSDGVVELRITPEGDLVEVGRWLGGEDGFRVDRVFVIGDRLWVFGNGTLPFAKPAATYDDDDRDADGDDSAEVASDDGEDEDDDDADEDDVYEEPEGDPDTVVYALVDLDTPQWFGESGTQPKHLHALAGGGAIALESSGCLRFPVAGKPERLFRERDLEPRAWCRVGDHLVVLGGSELVVYAIDPSSPLAGLVPP